MNAQDTREIADILISEYYSLGVESGHEALASLLTDFYEGRLIETFHDWGVTSEMFRNEIFWRVSYWMYSEGVMFTTQHDYYQKS